MRAVNLAPSTGGRFSTSALGQLGGGTAALFGVLALALVMVVGWVTLSNKVTERQQQLAKVTAQQAAAEKQVAQLKPYADLDGLRKSLLEKVRSLAAGRYNWPTAVEQLARAFPSDVTLTSFDGSPAGSGTTSTSAAPTTAVAGPTVNLNGCTTSHDAAARLVDRLRAVKVVAGVTLQSSIVAADTSSATCPGDETFKVQVQLKAPDAPAATAAAAPGTTPPATPTTTTPAPAASTPTASAGTSTGGAS